MKVPHKKNAQPEPPSSLWVDLSEAEAETIQGGEGIKYPVIVRFDPPKKTQIMGILLFQNPFQ